MYDDEKLYETVSNYYDALLASAGSRIKEALQSNQSVWRRGKAGQTIEKLLGAKCADWGVKKALDSQSPSSIFS